MVSGNQYADNAAGQAKKLFSAYDMCDGQYCYYPPFSPRWSFSFEGCLTTKGATKVWHEKLDDELILRQQLRSKQGLFLRMNSFNSLSTSQIGDESILRNLMKMTAMCWTRSVYRNPQLANHIWSFWRHSAHNAQIIDTLPVTIPKNWKKNPYICDDIIKACPFCSTFTGKNSKGNLEHLHIYCPSRHLQRVRSYCNEKLEKAIHNLYDYVSYRESNCSMQERNRMCTLQENLIVAAKEAELQERPTVQSNQIIFETRPENLAIKSRHEIQLSILLKKLPPSKLQEYDTFPLCSQLGFLHAIPEESFDVSLATVTDVSFLGFFPKRIQQELRRYYREIENITPTASGEFQALMDELIDAFVHRPITIQKVIHILIAQHKEGIDKLAKRREALANPASDNNMIPTARSNSLKAPSEKTKPTAKTSIVKRQCYAAKCRLLQAKGIVLRPMFCVTGRHM